MKIIVTGANGFLGSWLCKHLQEQGHEVTALVRKNSDLTELQNLKLQYAYGDVTQKNTLLPAFENADYVCHLAGVIAYKKADRPLMDKVNITGTQNVVETLALLQKPKLLHLSSVVAIGAQFGPQVMDEAFEFNIHDLNLGYFETKHAAENIVRQSAQAKKIEAVCVNPSTIYGFGDAKKGSRKTQVKVARGQFPFYTGGGVNVVAVEDVCEGISQAMKHGKNGERYILSGDNMTIHQLFEKISLAAGVKSPKIYLPFSVLKTIGLVGDLFSLGLSVENAYTASMYHWFSNSKAKTELGFKPSSADLAIQKSVKWMKDNNYLN